VALSAFVAIPMVVLALRHYYPGFRRSAGPEIRHIAVLPFVNLSADQAQEYFADGLTDEIIMMLGRVNSLLPIARSSAFRFKGQPVDVLDVGKKLKVDLVLEGSIRTAGDRVRITVHLSDASSGRQIWSEAYEEPLKDIFSVQKNVALSVVERLGLSATGPETANVQHPADLATYNLYLKGRFFWNQRTEYGVRMAIANFEQAIARDPAYAAAYAGLADAYGISQNYAYRNPREIWPKAFAAAERAVQLEPNSAETLSSLGHVLAFYRHDWEGAKHAFERAIVLNPGYATAHQFYASMYLLPLGRLREAETKMRLAARLDPLSPILQSTLGTILYFQGNHDAAVNQYKFALELEPRLCRPHAYLAEVFYRKSMPEHAEEWALRGLELCGHDPMMVGWAGHVYGGLGKRERALELLRKLGQMSHAHVSPFLLAIVHLGLSDTGAAFEYFSKAVDEPNIWMAFIRSNPMFTPYREDPRYKDLVKRMGLEQAHPLHPAK
jgi:TolB-like protein/Flp pilus assembly protein TadD